jgi:glycosyltransferase involved in cell wall biosynthesis
MEAIILSVRISNANTLDSINVDAFKKIIKHFLRKGFNFIMLKDFADRKIESNNNIILLLQNCDRTIFDALNYLEFEGIPATVFTPISVLRRENQLTMEDLYYMQKRGFDIQNAGILYYNVLLQNSVLKEDYNQAQLKKEIIEGKEILEKAIGKKSEFFAYPFGVMSIEAENLLRQEGYKGAIIRGNDVNTDSADLFKLKSIMIERDDSINDILNKINNKKIKRRLLSYPKFSIVIPTYNRKELLSLVVKSLYRQNYPKDKYEILICDDGSSDGTKEMLLKLAKKSPVALKYCWQKDLGYRAAAARNMGIKYAKNEVILFIDGDIICHPDLLYQHARARNLFPDRIVIGYAAAHTVKNVYETGEILTKLKEDISNVENLEVLPEYRDDIYSQCLGNLDDYQAPWMTFATNNVSVLRKQLENAGLFDKSFVGWGIEDIELGYRLHRRGVKYVFNRDAIGFHLGTDDVSNNPYLSPDPKKYAALSRNMNHFYHKFPTMEVKKELVSMNAFLPHEYRIFNDEPESVRLFVGRMCNDNSPMNRFNNLPLEKSLAEIKEEMDRIGNRVEIIFEGGEPTLHENLLDFTRYATFAGFERTGLATNARAMAYRDFAEKVVFHGGLKFYEIIIFGTNSTIHDAITGIKGSFLQTMQGVENIMKYNKNVKFRLYVTQENKLYLDEIEEFKNEHGIDVIIDDSFLKKEKLRKKKMKIAT